MAGGTLHYPDCRMGGTGQKTLRFLDNQKGAFGLKKKLAEEALKWGDLSQPSDQGSRSARVFSD